MPAAQVVAVVAFRGIPGGDAEIREVAVCAGLAIVMIAGHGMDPFLVTSPGGVEAFFVARVRAVGVRVVPQDEHRAPDGVEQPARGLIVSLGTRAYVSRPDEDLWCTGRVDDGCERVPRHTAVRIRDAHAHMVLPSRAIRVFGGQRAHHGGGAPLVRGAVPPVDLIAPRGFALLVRDAEGELCGRRWLGAEIGAGVNRWRRFRRWRVVTGRGAGIAECLARDRHELPAVAIRGESELQHAVGR